MLRRLPSLWGKQLVKFAQIWRNPCTFQSKLFNQATFGEQAPEVGPEI